MRRALPLLLVASCGRFGSGRQRDAARSDGAGYATRDDGPAMTTGAIPPSTFAQLQTVID